MRIATRVPTPCCREISPFSSSSFIALLTVTRDSAVPSAICRSGGKNASAASTCCLIAVSIAVAS